MTEDQHRADEQPPARPDDRPDQQPEQQPDQQPDQQPAQTGDGADPDGADPATAVSFGDPRVDAAVARTDGLDDRPVNEHVEVFDDVHRSFRDALDDPGDGA